MFTNWFALVEHLRAFPSLNSLVNMIRETRYDLKETWRWWHQTYPNICCFKDVRMVLEAVKEADEVKTTNCDQDCVSCTGGACRQW